ARGVPIAAGSPFLLVSPPLRRAIGVRDHEAIEVVAQRLRAHLESRMPSGEVDRVVDFLGVLLGAPDSDASVRLRAARSDAMLMHEQIRRAWQDFLDAEASAHPLLVVIEDLHWGDVPSV